MSPPEPGIHYQTWIALIFVFGLAYYMIFRDMYASRNLVVIAIGGKLVSATPMLVGLMVMPDKIPQVFIVPIITDLAFGVLFLTFFVSATRQRKWKSFAAS